MEEKEDQDEPVAMTSMDISTKSVIRPIVKPVAKSSVRRNETPSIFSPGGFTDKNIDRLILEPQDGEYKKYRQEEEEKEQKRKIREQVTDKTRHDRFMGLRKLLEEHGFRILETAPLRGDPPKLKVSPLRMTLRFS